MDPGYYRSIYPDLHQLSNLQILEHWYLHGIEEGRQGVPWFWIQYYLEANSDLKKAFGSNYSLAFEHWKSDGHREGRVTAPNAIFQLYWGDVESSIGKRSLADGSGECVPEPPIEELPSVGKILGVACKSVPHLGIKMACKFVLEKIIKVIEGKVVVCDNRNPEAGGVEIRPDPIFTGDINVPDIITRTA